MSSKAYLDCSKCDGGGLLRGRQLDVDHFEADVACDDCGGEGTVENPDYDPTPNTLSCDDGCAGEHESYRRDMIDAGRGHLLR